jgi:hypothetical protein
VEAAATKKNDDSDEFKEWQEKWLAGKTAYSDPMQEINRFRNFLDETFGRKTWSPHAKRWWNDDLDKQRKQLLSLPRHSPEFKAARFKWFKVVRKAKRECWENFLQESDPDRIWKTINSKPARHAIPTLRIRSEDGADQVVATHSEKVAAISAISFPEREAFFVFVELTACQNSDLTNEADRLISDCPPNLNTGSSLPVVK